MAKVIGLPATRRKEKTSHKLCWQAFVVYSMASCINSRRPSENTHTYTIRRIPIDILPFTPTHLLHDQLCLVVLLSYLHTPTFHHIHTVNFCCSLIQCSLWLARWFVCFLSSSHIQPFVLLCFCMQLPRSTLA